MQWLKDRFDFLTSHIVETLVLGIITSVIASYIFLRLQGHERTLLKQIWQACRNHPATVQHLPDTQKDDWILIRYARFLMEEGKPNEAQESLLEAITFNPGNAEAYKNLGKSREMLGDAEERQQTKLYFYSEAHAAYAEAVRIKSNLVSGYRHFARLLAKLGRQAEAEDAYKKAKSIRSDPNVNRDYGVFLSKIGRIEESILELKSARDQFAKERNEEGVKQAEDLLTNLTEGQW
jgi:tetratricopeptide (TPR) repeat protein